MPAFVQHTTLRQPRRNQQPALMMLPLLHTITVEGYRRPSERARLKRNLEDVPPTPDCGAINVRVTYRGTSSSFAHLQHHAKNRPSHEDQNHPPKETQIAPPLFPLEEKHKRPSHPDGHRYACKKKHVTCPTKPGIQSTCQGGAGTQDFRTSRCWQKQADTGKKQQNTGCGIPDTSEIDEPHHRPIKT